HFPRPQWERPFGRNIAHAILGGHASRRALCCGVNSRPFPAWYGRSSSGAPPKWIARSTSDTPTRLSGQVGLSDRIPHASHTDLIEGPVLERENDDVFDRIGGVGGGRWSLHGVLRTIRRYADRGATSRPGRPRARRDRPGH